MTIKGIIFDKDGTLFDFQQSWGTITFNFLIGLAGDNKQKLSDLAKVLKFDLTKKMFQTDSSFVSGTVSQTIDLISPLLPNMSREEIWALQNYHYSKIVQIPVKNLHKTLFNLRARNYSLGIATNDLAEPTYNQLKKESIFKYFDKVLGADSGFGCKPAATQLIEITKALNISPQETVMVGDSLDDLKAAKKAQMAAVGVTTGVLSKKDLSKNYDVVLDGIEALVAWLDDFNGS